MCHFIEISEKWHVPRPTFRRSLSVREITPFSHLKPSHPLLYLTLFFSICQAFSLFWLLAFSVLFIYPYMFLLLVVVVGSVEMWNCLCIPLFSLCLRVFFVWITMWIGCGYAVDNFWVVVSRSFVAVLARSRQRNKKRVFCDVSWRRGC